jgi:hypothetical protein
MPWIGSADKRFGSQPTCRLAVVVPPFDSSASGCREQCVVFYV